MVKKGYKQTEVGVLPENWETSSLSDAFQKLEAGVSVNSDNSLSSEYHILKTSAIHDGVVDTAETKPVIPQDYLRLKCPLVKGSIIISRMNTPALVGECGFTKDAKAGTYLPDRLWQIQNFNKSNFHFIWLNYLLNTKQYRDAVRATATGTSNSMKNISKERMLDIEIPRPPINEQENIAAALSEVDELINLVEKQIDKKKAIKQGAMQELLTGKRRLPGFSEKWEEKPISFFGNFVSGNCFPIKYQGCPSGELPFYKVSDFNNAGNSRVMDKANNYISHNVASVLSCKIIPKNSVVFAKIGAAISLERKRITGCNCCIDNNMMSFLPYQKNIATYMCYLLQTIRFGEFVEATALPSLSGKTIGEIQRTFPPTIEEQIAIATVLSDLDSEIEALEQKLTKYRQVKQGMMQQLLTGKIRLV